MSSQRKAKLRERGYNVLFWIGIAMIAAVLTMQVAIVTVYANNWSCGELFAGKAPAPEPICTVASMYPNGMIVLGVVLLGVGLALWAAAASGAPHGSEVLK